MDKVKPQIIIVDDEPANLRLAVSVLKDFVDVIPAPSAKELFRFLGTNKDGIDLILLDINMPELDGFQTLDQLNWQDRTAQIPVVFFSSSKDKEDVTRAIKKGAIGYILKPFSRESLLERVSNYLKMALFEIVDKALGKSSATAGKGEIIIAAFQKMDAVIAMARELPPVNNGING